MIVRATQILSFSIIGLTALFGVLAAIHLIVSSPLGSEAGAAWTQAVLSVAAIVGTWLSTKHQLEHQRDERKNERLVADAAIAQIAYDLAYDARNAIRGVSEKFLLSAQTRTKVPIGTERLVDLQESLRILAAKDVDPEIWAHLLIIQREVAYTITSVNQYAAQDYATPERVEKCTNRLHRVFEARMKIERQLKDARTAIGSDKEVTPTNLKNTDF